jgi:hypothetical protein
MKRIGNKEDPNSRRGRLVQKKLYSEKLQNYPWYFNKVTSISSKPFLCYVLLISRFFSVLSLFSVSLSGTLITVIFLSETRLSDGATLHSLHDRLPAAKAIFQPLLYLLDGSQFL